MARGESLSPQQKLSLGVVVVIGITTFVFGMFQINKAIVLPFVRDRSATFKSLDELEKEKEAQMKEQDSDGDGLNDWDELYVFRTSPFLDDSDSDGVNDGKEVASMTDPNCPIGKVCRQVRQSEKPVATAVTEGGLTVPANVPPEEQQILDVMQETFGDVSQLTPEGISAKLQEMSIDELRGFLVKLGIPKETIDQADDETLRSILQESLEEASGTVPEESSASDLLGGIGQ